MIFQGHADTHKGKVCFKEKYRAASIVTERGESVPPNRGNHEFISLLMLTHLFVFGWFKIPVYIIPVPRVIMSVCPFL